MAEGREREGREEGRRKGDIRNGREGKGHGMAQEGKEKGKEGKRGEGLLTASLQFLAPPLQPTSLKR